MRGVLEARRLAKSLRKAAKMTQSDLADRLQLRQPCISRIENERIKTCSLQNLEAVLNYFDHTMLIQVVHEPPSRGPRPGTRSNR
jgi:transcriptional regulator with XRE-family HTH domain